MLRSSEERASDYGLHNLERLELPPKNRLALRPEPMLQNARINGAEIQVELRVALEQISGSQTWHFAEETSFYFVTNDEHRPSGAVISAGVSVLRDATAKLAE